MRISAIGDLHVRAEEAGRFRETFAAMSAGSDLMVLAGDLTEFGLETEARCVADDIMAAARVPVVAVLGNHDYYSGKVPEITAIFRDAGINVLEGDTVSIDGVDIVGLKGSVGGFHRMLSPISEPEVVAFAELSIEAAAVLDRELSKAKSARRLVVLHYAPIIDTIMGEHPEEYAFMGSSRFAEVIDRHRPDRVLHGHSHYGFYSGTTPGGVPVNNVAMQVKKPDASLFGIFEI